MQHLMFCGTAVPPRRFHASHGDPVEYGGKGSILGVAYEVSFRQQAGGELWDAYIGFSGSRWLAWDGCNSPSAACAVLQTSFIEALQFKHRPQSEAEFLDEQITRLATFITKNDIMPQGFQGGAVDCAIDIINKLRDALSTEAAAVALGPGVQRTWQTNPETPALPSIGPLRPYPDEEPSEMGDGRLFVVRCARGGGVFYGVAEYRPSPGGEPYWEGHGQQLGDVVAFAEIREPAS